MLKNKIRVYSSNTFFASFQTTYSCSIKNRYVIEDLFKAEAQVNKEKKKSKKFLNALLLAVNFLIITGIFIYYSITSGIKHPAELFELDIKWRYLIYAFLAFVVGLIIETAKCSQLIKKSTGKYRVKLSFEAMALARYYDHITPLSIGGEPYQIYYLNKNKISGEVSTSIPVVKHVFWQISYVILGLIALIYNFFVPITNNLIVIIIAIVSLVGNALIICLILFLTISKRIAQVVIIKILKFLNKVRIIKNYKITFFKVLRFVKRYQKSMRFLASNLKTVILQLIYAIISTLSNFIIVYFIYKAFPHVTPTTLSVFDVMICMMLCDLTACIMPLPGGTGLAEFSFGAVFSSWFMPGIFPWALIIWRTLTYFSSLILGGILILKNFISAKIKSSKMMRKNNP